MKPILNKGYSGWAQLGIFCAVLGAAMVLGVMVSAGLWSAMTGQGIMNIEQDMLRPQYANATKIFQTISTLLVFFAPAVAYAFVCYRNGWLALGYGRKPYLQTLIIALLIMLAAAPTVDALAQLNKAIPISASLRKYFDEKEKAYEAMVRVMGDVRTLGQYFLSVILLSLLPALFEETLFRGGLQNLLSRWWKSPIAAIIVASLLFSAIHGSWYGFLPRAGLGILLGLLFHYTQNIWYCIAAHFLNNATVITLMFLSGRTGKTAPAISEPSMPWWLGVLALALIIVLFRWLIKTRKEEPVKEVIYDRFNPFDTNRNTD